MSGCDQGCRSKYIKGLYSQRDFQVGRLTTMLDEQKKVGTLPKDTTTGPFADDWKRTFSEISKDVEEVDITPALSNAFAIKDPEELVSFLLSTSGKASLLTESLGLHPQRVQGMQWPDVGILRGRDVTTAGRGEANYPQGSRGKG
jgi:hypothetical protein